LLDCIVSLATPGHDTALALGMHGGATALVAVLGVVLFRGQADSISETIETTSSTTAMPSDIFERSATHRGEIAPAVGRVHDATDFWRQVVGDHSPAYG
jgi:hypothetical protein